MAFEEIAAHRQFVANELIAGLERVETVARDGSHAYDRAAQNLLQFVLQFLKRDQRMRVLDLLADAEDRCGELAGPFRCDPGDLGVERPRRSSRSR
jgi:hypothetical protein